MFVLVALAATLAWALRTALIRQARQEQEHRRLERDLEIAHRMDALGFLAASVAHDFNNVLSAIVGYAELARKSVSAESSGLASMDRLLAATERARELIRRVLTFDPKRSIEYAPWLSAHPRGSCTANRGNPSADNDPAHGRARTSGVCVR